jgi:hypothetical protein
LQAALIELHCKVEKILGVRGAFATRITANEWD